MAQATRSGQLTFSDYVERALREGVLWTLMCVALYLALSLASYSPEDPGWSFVGDASRVTNTGGRTGAWFADASLYLFGYFAYLVPLMVGFSAWVLFRGRDEEAHPRSWVLAMRWVGFVLTLAAGCGFAAMHFDALGLGLPNGTGGGLGQFVSGQMQERFGPGTEVLLAGVLLLGFTLFSGISWLALLDSVGDGLLQGARALGAGISTGLAALARRRDQSETNALPKDLKLIDQADLDQERAAAVPGEDWGWPQSGPPLTHQPDPEVDSDVAAEDQRSAESDPPMVPKVLEPDRVLTLSDLLKGQRPVPKDAPRVQKVVRRANPVPPAPTSAGDLPADPVPARPLPHGLVQLAPPVRSGAGERPPLNLLDPARKTGKGYSDEQIEDLSRQVEIKLADFGVTVQVVAVHPGPVVTLFELQLAPGTKASKIAGLVQGHRPGPVHGQRAGGGGDPRQVRHRHRDPQRGAGDRVPERDPGCRCLPGGQVAPDPGPGDQHLRSTRWWRTWRACPMP